MHKSTIAKYPGKYPDITYRLIRKRPSYISESYHDKYQRDLKLHTTQRELETVLNDCHKSYISRSADKHVVISSRYRNLINGLTITELVIEGLHS